MPDLDFKDFFGNKPAREYLTAAFQNGRLAHAYAFIGPSEVGKRRAAETIARTLLGTSEFHRHPDIRIIERGRNEKTGKRQRDITIDAIRELNAWLHQTAAYGIKIVIIDDAETMNLEAANALLKNLEEPRGRAHIFLIMSDAAAVPETVLSRTERIFFTTATQGELEEFLVQNGTAPKDKDNLLLYAAGRPGRARRLIEDAAYRSWFETENTRFQQLITEPLYARFKTVESFWAKNASGANEDHVENRDRLTEILGLWILRLREMLLAAHAAKRTETVRVARLIDLIFTAIIDLRYNVHPKLVIEKLLIAFSYA